MENNTAILSREFSPSFKDKDNSIQLQILSSGAKVNDETAQFNSGSKYYNQIESARKVGDTNEFSKESKIGSERKPLAELSENQYFEVENKENKPFATDEMNSIDIGTNEAAAHSPFDQNTSFSAHNHSGMLLPNPIPRKKRKSSTREDKENNVIDPVPSHRASVMQSSKSNYTDLQNSANSSFLRHSIKEDDQGFKDYNRKFHGKPFRERIEYLGNTIEDTIRENVQENLRIVKEKLLQQPRKSHDMIITLDGYPSTLREEQQSVQQQSVVHHHHYYHHHQSTKSEDLSCHSQQNLLGLYEGQAGFANQRDSVKGDQREILRGSVVLQQTQTEGRSEDLMTKDWHQNGFQFESYLMEKVNEIRKFSCKDEPNDMKEIVPTLGHTVSISESDNTNRNAAASLKEGAVDNFKSTYRLSSQSLWKSKNSTLDSVFCATSNRQEMQEILDFNFEKQTNNLRGSQQKSLDFESVSQSQTIKPQPRSRSTQKREHFVIRQSVSTEKPMEDSNDKNKSLNFQSRNFLTEHLQSTGGQSNGYNTRYSYNFSEDRGKEQTLKHSEHESKSVHAKQASIDGIEGMSIGMGGDFNPFDSLNQKMRNSTTIAQDIGGANVDQVDFNRFRHPSVSVDHRANRSPNIPKSKSFSENTVKPTFAISQFHKRNVSTLRNRESSIEREEGARKQELVEEELKCVDLINSNQFDEALNLLFRYLSYLIAECYAKKNQYTEALAYSEKALKIIFDSQDYREDKFVYLYAYALLNILGTISLKQNKFERAVQTFNQIEEFVSKDDGYAYEVERERSQIEEELHVIFFNRGNAYMGLNNHQQAHEDYQKALELLSLKHDKPNRKRYVMCLKKFAICKHKLSLHEDALVLLQSAIQEILENKSMEQDLKLLASIYDQAAAIYGLLGKLREMIKYYNTSLQIKIDVYGMNDEQTAMAFLAAGKAFLENKEYEKALYKFQAGNEILEKLHGRYSIHSANCYVCMAQMRYKMKNYVQAVDLYEIALDIYINLLGTAHLYTYRICLNLLYLGFVLKDTHKIDFFEKKLVRTLGDQTNHNAFIIYNEIGNIFRKNHKFKQALNYYFRSINIFEYLENKEAHYEGLSLVYCNIASTHLLKKDFHEGIKNYKIALRILDSIKTKNIERKAQINANLGKIFRSLKHVKDAKFFLQEAERLYILANAKQSRIEAIRRLLETL